MPTTRTGQEETAARPVPGGGVEERALAEQVRQLHARGLVAQVTVVVNAAVVAWVFRAVVPARTILAWFLALVLLASLRVLALRRYASRPRAPAEARRWAHVFTAGAALVGLGWGAAPLLFRVPGAPAYQLFLAFVLGGMAAGAASSNATHTPAFLAFAIPALLPLTVTLAAEGDRLHLAMAFLVALFGVAVTMISRTGGRAVSEAVRLRLHNEGLVEHLTMAQERLAALNAGLEQRVAERTRELERTMEGRRQLERQLAQAGLLAGLGSLAAGVAHQINNPLAYVTSNLRHLRDELARGEPGAAAALGEVAEEALEGAARIRRIVRDLGALSPRSAEALGPVELAPVIESCLAVTAEEVRPRARLVRELGTLPPVLASRAGLAQVVSTLLLRAAHAIPEGRPAEHAIHLSARWERAAGEVVLEVTDSGRTIPPADLERVFEPYSPASAAPGEVGLDLSICHAIVAALGGRISARGLPGGGSAFAVVLRAATSSVPEPPPPPTTPPSIEDERSARILVIDDEPGVGRALRRALRQREVVVVGGGAEGLRALAEQSFDVVLCDLMMPGMSGMEVYARLASLRPGAERKLVFVTGGTFSEDATRFLASVPNPRLEKPFHPEEVQAAVREVLARARDR